MFAAIHIPDFSVEAIVRLKPELRERAVAVLEGTPPLLRVVGVNDKAAEAGLEPGMTKLQAEERAAACNGVLAMRSAEQEQSARAALIDVACSFSPRVEDTAPGLTVLDLAGLERVFGSAAKIARDLARRCSDIGLEAQVAVAANPDAAVHAARGFSGVTVIPEGREAERLATLPVDVLSVPAPPPPGKNSKKTEASPDLLNTLESWGVRNLRALAALPEVAVSERLGQAGVLWQRMARGATHRALKLIEPPLRFQESCELDDAVESLEPLSFLLNRMLEQLCARLEARALATNELRVTLTLDPHADLDIRCPDDQMIRFLRLPVPMLDAKIFLKLLQLDLQANPPGAAVEKIMIVAQPTEPRRTQDGLFQPSAPQPERLEVTLARIQASVGGGQAPAENPQSTSEMRVGSAEVLDTHRPGAFRMNRFSTASVALKRTREKPAAPPPPARGERLMTALRLFRPALDAQVVTRNGKPVRIACEAVQGEITWAAGPWKSSGEWWNEQPWAREEWDVCVGAACYRLYRDGKGWFVEGAYD